MLELFFISAHIWYKNNKVWGTVTNHIYQIYLYNRSRNVWPIHSLTSNDDVIKWKHFPRYWPFVLGIHRSPVNSPHTGQRRGPLVFSLICFWPDGWVNNGEAGDLRRYRAHYDVRVMALSFTRHVLPSFKDSLLIERLLRKVFHLWQSVFCSY